MTKTAVFAVVLFLSAGPPASYGQTSPRARTLVTEAVNESKRVTLWGNTRPEATAAHDRGKVPGGFRMDHMYLQLKRSPESEAALTEFISQLHDPGSSSFHHWITAEQFGEQFGLSQDDLAAVTEWLESFGFTVNHVYPNLVIDFSGTAAQIEAAFQTQIHYLSVNGQQHVANMSDPEVPAALASVLGGIASLNNFRPQRMSHPVPSYTISSIYQAVTPADLATVYDFNPAFDAGLTGKRQTIVVLEDSDVYNVNDWGVFRKTFGLARRFRNGSFRQVHPGPGLTGTAGSCADPGANADDAEATLDAEWASAAAPDAAIVLASCANTNANFGAFIAMENMLTNGGPVPSVFSISYGGAEAQQGEGANLYVYSLCELAVAEGASVFVATGDWGAAGSDENATSAVHGIGINGLASTPFNVAMGGTDFADTYFGIPVPGPYWSSRNTPVYGSAQSYIPEIPWNDSCAGALLSGYAGFPAPFGANGFCNSSVGANFITTTAAGGGPSGCATGTPSVSEVVSGTCQGYPKPEWQNVAGNPGDGVRDVPDLSVFAANGLWGHYYVVCYSDIAQGGRSCLGSPSRWSGFGGTSLAAPIMAGIQALINQYTGSNWGNPNPVYYALASSQYGPNGNSACDASQGNSIDPGCIFHDVTLGDMAVNCTGTNNCYLADGQYGVLSTDNNSYQPAYPAAAGWDFATGIGSVDVKNLLISWPRPFSVVGSSAKAVGNPQ
ncbi:MAG: hypothetical protein JO108_34285 [Acidobacteriaceae bacterium]|nr:hypothetical protein [Acidobacteriaceae bacterium]